MFPLYNDLLSTKQVVNLTKEIAHLSGAPFSLGTISLHNIELGPVTGALRDGEILGFRNRVMKADFQ